MTHCAVAILGGGLAGLNAARLLHRAGVDFLLYEARDRFGGRILTLDQNGLPSQDGFDLGPSWFWPRVQPDIAGLVAELGLPAFPQHSAGDVIFERMSREGPQRYAAPPQDATSFRLAGGSAALVQAIVAGLPGDRLLLDSPVSALVQEGDRLRLGLPQGEATADHVIAALPPRLLHRSIRFSPDLPPETARLWQATPTWMAPHAKFFALYDRPFWREAGLSGTAQSMVGPMPELHDACTQRGNAALFGFLGVGPGDRARLGADSLTRACLDQLVRLFGPEAGSPIATLMKDWAADPLTATALDLADPGHPEPVARWVHGAWSGRLVLAGSEAAPREPGYLSGAVSASAGAVASVLAKLL
jgi:monoamine oxidase